MFDLSFIFLIKSSSAVIIIFWIITYIFSFFFIKYELKFKYDFYECGFKSISDLCFSINISISVVMSFVILYDIELLFLVPYLVCNNGQFGIGVFNIFFFIFSIFYTFVVDLYEGIIEWNF